MGSNNIKYYINNFNLEINNQGRMSKSLDSFMKNAPRKVYDNQVRRKITCTCEVVLNGESGVPLCRLTFPKKMGKSHAFSVVSPIS